MVVSLWKKKNANPFESIVCHKKSFAPLNIGINAKSDISAIRHARNS